MGASCSVEHLESNAAVKRLKAAGASCGVSLPSASPKATTVPERPKAVLKDQPAYGSTHSSGIGQIRSRKSRSTLSYSLSADSSGNSSAESTPRQTLDHVLGRNMRQFRHEKIDNPDRDDVELEGDLQDKKFNEALLRATRAGDFKASVDALNAGASVHCQNLRKQTPLMMAAGSPGKGACDCIKFLLEAEAEVESKDELGWTPLMFACRNNQMDQVALLLEHMANIRVRTDDARTPMMLAAVEGSETLIQYLADQKAPMDKKDDRGWTVLFVACDLGHVELVKWLLKKQINVRDRAKDGKTPLIATVGAPTGAANRIVMHLLKKNASVNLKTVEGNTALMWALYNNKEEMADYLMEEQPDLDVLVKNTDGEDAIDLAERAGFNALKVKIELRARIQAEALSALAERKLG